MFLFEVPQTTCVNEAPSPSISDVSPLPDGWYVLAFKVLSGGRLAIIAADLDYHAARKTDYEQKTVGQAQRAAANATAQVLLVQDGSLYEGIRFPLEQPFSIIEQFPDGRWLVAHARSRGRGNARVFDANGAEQRRFELGDGIEHVKIDDTGRIWVGWFDEGVFGNDDWRLPGRKWPPSAHGLAAFDDMGALVTHATLESVADCYALNVVGVEAWACTYTDFPISRLGIDGEKTWQTNLSGTRAIAVKAPFVLAAGGYREDGNRVVLLKLDEDRAQTIGEWRLPFDVGFPQKVDLIDARGDDLHVVVDRKWFRWSVSDFAKR